MRQTYIEEDQPEFIICDPQGKELARFDQVREAYDWAIANGLLVYSNISPEELNDCYHVFYRRGLRRLRLRRMRFVDGSTRRDPPNVQRIIVPDSDSWFDFFGDDDDDGDDPFFPPEEIELVPSEDIEDDV